MMVCFWIVTSIFYTSSDMYGEYFEHIHEHKTFHLYRILQGKRPIEECGCNL
jgi:hypothetical protein